MSSNTSPYIGTMAGFNGSYTISDNTTFAPLTVSDSVTTISTPLVVNGRDVMQEIDEMRDALLLLKRDVNMEAKDPKLKELKDAYERQLEKYKTFDAIKESR